MLKLGAVFPFTTVGSDPGAILEFAKGVEQIGYDQILAYDHVIGANPASRPDWIMPYVNTTPFYEPFTLFGFLAGATRKVELISAVLILSQRQTVLAAKQAATVDVLCQGRLRLGVGTGWNVTEYDALNADFLARGNLLDEQISLMRQLWADESVCFRGRFHKVDDAGIAPLPPNRSIPIWIGGVSPAAMRRAARMGDGWLPYAPAPEVGALIERFDTELKQAGKTADELVIESIIFADPADRPDFGHLARTVDDALTDAEVWRRYGVSHLAFHTMAASANDIDGHLRFLEEVRRGLLGSSDT